MNPTVVIWILAAVVCVFVGREVGKLMFGANKDLIAKKRAALTLATKLRDAGLKLLPTLLEDFSVGGVDDLLQKIHDTAKLVESGSDAIEKELEADLRERVDEEARHARGHGPGQGEDRRDRERSAGPGPLRLRPHGSGPCGSFQVVSPSRDSIPGPSARRHGHTQPGRFQKPVTPLTQAHFDRSSVRALVGVVTGRGRFSKGSRIGREPFENRWLTSRPRGKG